MLEFYPQVRAVHIAAISLSGVWFALRAASLLVGLSWPRWIGARALGWTIDGTLLTAATMLYSMLPSEVFANHWLATKLCFVAIYLGGSWTALQAEMPRCRRAALAGLALAAWGIAYGIARAQSPLGWLA